jgi:aldehyde:ferredoxin oxidoreductase
MCLFATFSPSEIAGFYSLITGVSTTPEELMRTGERIITLKRLVNLKLGMTSKDDTLPAILLRPLEGPTRGLVPNLQRQLQDYYAYRKWDSKTGRPSTAKLVELGLDKIMS